MQKIFLAEIWTNWVFSYGGINSANPTKQIFLIVLKMNKNISSKCRLVAKKTQKSNINVKKYSILYINKMFLILVFYFSSFSLEKRDENPMFALSGGLRIQLSFDWQKWSICLIAKMKDRFPLHKSYMQIFNLSITNCLLFHKKRIL